MHNKTPTFARTNGLFWLALVGMSVGLALWGRFHWQIPPWHDSTAFPLRIAASIGHAVCGSLALAFFTALAPTWIRATIQQRPRLLAFFRGYLLLWWCVAWAGLGLPLFGWTGGVVWIVSVFVYTSTQDREASYTEALQSALPFVLLGVAVIHFAPMLLAWLWWIAPWFGLFLVLCSLPFWRWSSDAQGALLGMMLLLLGFGPWLAREQRYTNVLFLAHTSDLQPATMRPFFRHLTRDTSLPVAHTQKLLGLFLVRPSVQHQTLRRLLEHWTHQPSAAPLPKSLLQQIPWTAATERLLREQLQPHPKHQMLLRQQALAFLAPPQDAALAARILLFFVRQLPQHNSALTASIFPLYFSTSHQDPQHIEHILSISRAIHGKDASAALFRFFFKHVPRQSAALQQQWLHALLSTNAQDVALLRRSFSSPLRVVLQQHLRSVDTTQQILGLRLLAHIGHDDAEWLATFWDTLPSHFLDSKLRHPHPSLRAYAHALRFKRWASQPLRTQQLVQALQDPSPIVRYTALSAFPSLHQQLQDIAPQAPIDPRLSPLLFQVALQSLLQHTEEIEAIAYTLPRLTLTHTQKQQAFSAAKALLPLQQARSARFLRSLFVLLAALEAPSLPTTQPTSRPQPRLRPSTQPTSRP